MLYRSVLKFNQIIKNYFLQSLRLIIATNFIIGGSDLKAQKERTLEVFVGPNLTNVQQIVNGEKIFYTTPERPFYTFQYHLGVTLNERIFSYEDWSISYGLSFEKRASANTAFNKYIEESYGFLGVPFLANFKPLNNREISLVFGTNFQYLIYNSKYAYAKAFNNFEIDYVVGIQCKLWKKMSIGARFLEPLLLMKENGNVVNIDPNLPKEKRQYKTHSIELIFIYNLKI